MALLSIALGNGALVLQHSSSPWPVPISLFGHGVHAVRPYFALDRVASNVEIPVRVCQDCASEKGSAIVFLALVLDPGVCFRAHSSRGISQSLVRNQQGLGGVCASTARRLSLGCNGVSGCSESVLSLRINNNKQQKHAAKNMAAKH